MKFEKQLNYCAVADQCCFRCLCSNGTSFITKAQLLNVQSRLNASEERKGISLSTLQHFEKVMNAIASAVIVLYIAVIMINCGKTRGGARLGGITNVDEEEELEIVAKLRGHLKSNKLQDDNLT